MESFYGGRRGISFIIVKHFDGIDIPQPDSEGRNTYTGNYYAYENNKFKLTSANNLIIRTEKNKDKYGWKYHLNDGSLAANGVNFPLELAQGMKQCFEKGASTTDIVGYGEYVIIDTIKNCHNYNNLDNGKVYKRGMDFQNAEGGAEYVGQVIGPQGDSPRVDITGFTEVDEYLKNNFNNTSGNRGEYNTQEKGDLVSGKENDTIQYAWCDVKDDIGNIEGVKIGFRFPYPVFEFSSKSISAYDSPAISRVGDLEKPFYYELELGIPKGVHGTDAKDIRIEAASDKKGDAFWYTEIDYTNSDSKITHKEIGPYKVIETLNLAEDGTLDVNYTYGDPLHLDKKLNWITNASFSKETGKFIVEFNNENIEKIEETFKWISRAEISKDKAITYYYNTGEEAFTYKLSPNEFIIVDTKTNNKPSSLDSILVENGFWLVAEPMKFAE